MAQVTAGLDLAQVGVGDNVVIQGAGGLGLYAIAVARERGAGQVIVIDGVSERLEVASMFGADALRRPPRVPHPRGRASSASRS